MGWLHNSSRHRSGLHDANRHREVQNLNLYHLLLRRARLQVRGITFLLCGRKACFPHVVLKFTNTSKGFVLLLPFVLPQTRFKNTQTFAFTALKFKYSFSNSGKKKEYLHVEAALNWWAHKQCSLCRASFSPSTYVPAGRSCAYLMQKPSMKKSRDYTQSTVKIISLWHK